MSRCWAASPVAGTFQLHPIPWDRCPVRFSANRSVILQLRRLDSLTLLSRVFRALEHWFSGIFFSYKSFLQRVSVMLRFGKPRGSVSPDQPSSLQNRGPLKAEGKVSSLFLRPPVPVFLLLPPQNEGTFHKTKCIQHEGHCTLRFYFSYSGRGRGQSVVILQMTVDE